MCQLGLMCCRIYEWSLIQRILWHLRTDLDQSNNKNYLLLSWEEESGLYNDGMGASWWWEGLYQNLSQLLNVLRQFGPSPTQAHTHNKQRKPPSKYFIRREKQKVLSLLKYFLISCWKYERKPSSGVYRISEPARLGLGFCSSRKIELQQDSGDSGLKLSHKLCIRDQIKTRSQHSVLATTAPAAVWVSCGSKWRLHQWLQFD